MSILCNNQIVCTTENPETLSLIENWVVENISDFCDIEVNDDHTRLHFNLDHDHGFPAVMMQRMTNELPADNSLSISVLTHDQGHEYIVHHQFKDCRWVCLYENSANPIVERLSNHKNM